MSKQKQCPTNTKNLLDWNRAQGSVRDNDNYIQAYQVARLGITNLETKRVVAPAQQAEQPLILDFNYAKPLRYDL
ncbi:MAG: hypothetical protein DCE90_00790 [Pseudanabaena sp.]|nr:MAG: hypothetical protein DCE90_00790 [Pseudanabaena sp.]